ncbi:CPBP family intramembrane glutamic endopeptidase [Peribacillus glennii]|uniref:CPBP family intramembrane metalloprotease n=1 Tax=Peribacillus glennii TaxID=2303991 RepID=A0A372LGZ8_9BACI|nr:CPBP family intramembrane glutamic endopeptidase [Peribacillus glennii]RFU65570.1 CPBP family intramembrane metalloprotease [Peribacillus glennii]
MKNKQAEIIKQLTDKELHMNLFLTHIILLMLSAVLGIFLFDNQSQFFKLFRFQYWNILFIGGSAAAIVILFDLLAMKLLPESYQDDGGVNERIFKSLSYPMIFLVALSVAISEEILFRGVIQTHLGLFWSSLIFAVVHFRYLFNWFLFLNITVLSFFIGLIFELTDNLLVTVFAHFLIDFILGIIVKIRGNDKG